VLSWFLLRGKCSKCKKNISIFHPVSEIVLGSMFAVTFCHVYNNTGSNNWLFVGIGLAVIVLYFFSVMDIFHGIVPNKQVYPVIIVMMWVRVVLSVKSPTPLYELLNYALAAAVYFSFFGVINFLSTRGLMPGVSGKKQGFGWGDAKYALLLGLLLGVRSMFVAMWVSIFAGGFISVILFLRSRNRNMAIPYVPFMSIGAWIAMLWGSEIADTVLRLLLI
ncbi:MAG: prepilin peptidase, partial [Patescibacteria group bacterium]|nr:prepilin peptidase [Patescibacteria group bacterium]